MNLDAPRITHTILSVDVQFWVRCHQSPSGRVNHKSELTSCINPIGNRQIDWIRSRNVIGNIKGQSVASILNIGDFPSDDLSVNVSIRKVKRQTCAIIDGQIPVRLLIPNQFASNDRIIKSADLCERVFVKDSDDFTLLLSAQMRSLLAEAKIYH